MSETETQRFEELLFACKSGNILQVHLSLAGDVDVNEKDKNGWTPLYAASLKGHLEVVEFLISKGGLVNEANNNGYTSIYC